MCFSCRRGLASRQLRTKFQQLSHQRTGQDWARYGTWSREFHGGTVEAWKLQFWKLGPLSLVVGLMVGSATDATGKPGTTVIQLQDHGSTLSYGKHLRLISRLQHTSLSQIMAI